MSWEGIAVARSGEMSGEMSTAETGQTGVAEPGLGASPSTAGSAGSTSDTSSIDSTGGTSSTGSTSPATTATTTVATTPAARDGGKPPASPSTATSAPPDGAAASILPTIGAGVVTALVGFASSFALVVAGLRAAGATPAQAASGLTALCLLMGATGLWFSLRHRQPISIAWSTPGAALLVGIGPLHGGYREALGAFAVAGALTVLTGASGTLTRWIAAIPAPLSAALLAGVLLPICLQPVHAAVQLPRLALPALAVWALLGRFAKRWAVPGTLVTALAGLALDHSTRGHLGGSLLPTLTFTTPGLSLRTLVSLAIPLYLVTMTAQNLTGVAVMRTYGYEPPIRGVLVATGGATVLGAPAGAISINFAAITAALAAGPDAHRDPRRRWIASATAGGLYLLFGLTAAAATALLLAAPPLLIEAVAGLALLGALGSSLTAALADADRKEAAVATFVVTASGITVGGIGAPFWGLAAGLVLTALPLVGGRGGQAVDGTPGPGRRAA